MLGYLHMFYWIDSGVPRILQMCMYILFCVCICGGVGCGKSPPSPPPPPPPTHTHTHKEKKPRKVYALRFVRTSSYTTDRNLNFWINKSCVCAYVGVWLLVEIVTSSYDMNV